MGLLMVYSNCRIERGLCQAILAGTRSPGWELGGLGNGFFMRHSY